jgi:hypothetical protein
MVMDQVVSTPRARRLSSLVAALALLLTVATTASAAGPGGHICNGCHALSGGAAGGSTYAGMPEPEAMAEPTSDLQPTQAANDAVSYTLSATTIRFKAGKYNLFKFNTDTGQLLRKKTVQWATVKKFSAANKLQSFGGTDYSKITSGKWSGWFAKATDAAPSTLTAFTEARQVRLAKGTHTGVRFYTSTRMSLRRSATLAAADTYEVGQKATFGSKVYFYLTNGPLANRWVAKSSAVTLVKTSEPDSGSGDSGSALGPPATWNGILMVYRETDVTFTRSDGSTYRLRASIGDSMYDLSMKVVNRFLNSVGSWSDNYTELNLKIVDMPAKLTKLDSLSGGKYWVGPKSVRTEMDKYAPPGAYDSIFVLFQHQDSSGVKIPLGGWGMTITAGSWSNGAGFTSIHVPSAKWWWTDVKYPEEVFVHEWMHQVLFWHEAAGRIKLDLHAAEKYGYTDSSGSWKGWLSDVMRGKVWTGSKYTGVDYKMWRSGTPTRPNGW